VTVAVSHNATRVRRGRRSAAPAAIVALGLVLASACTSSSPSVVASSSGTSARGDASTTSTTKATGRSSTTDAKGSPDSTDSTDATDTTDADPATEPDACDLITEDDATLAFGEPAVAGDQRHDECWWSTRNDLKTVNVIRRHDDVDVWRAGLQNEHWEKVDRGDEGYAGKTLDSITFRIGETQYEVNVVYSTKGDPKHVVEQLTDTVLSRL
jgi:hypothetical protein